MYLFWLKDVIIKKSVRSTSTSKGKLRTKRSGKSLGKMNLKVISLKSSEGSGAKVEKTRSPIKDQKAVKKKKKKSPQVMSSASSEDPPKATSQSFLRPMPYNEKLRLGGRENSRAIAETQVSRLEVLRERFRKEPTVHPYRCVKSLARKAPEDREVVSGQCLLRRSYSTQLTGQDRLLAEMAVRAGGSLHLPGHNIHLVPGLPTLPHVRRSKRIRIKSENQISPSLSELTVNIKEESEQKEEDKEEMEMEVDEIFLQQILEMEMTEDPSRCNDLDQMFEFDEKFLDWTEPPVEPPEENIDHILDSLLQFEDELLAGL